MSFTKTHSTDVKSLVYSHTYYILIVLKIRRFHPLSVLTFYELLRLGLFLIETIDCKYDLSYRMAKTLKLATYVNAELWYCPLPRGTITCAGPPLIRHILAILATTVLPIIVRHPFNDRLKQHMPPLFLMEIALVPAFRDIK